MRFVMPHCVIRSVNPSTKEGDNGQTNYIEVSDIDGADFSFSIKGASTEELRALILQPISIQGVLGGRRFGQNQVLSLREYQIGQVIGAEQAAAGNGSRRRPQEQPAS